MTNMLCDVIPVNMGGTSVVSFAFLSLNVTFYVGYPLEALMKAVGFFSLPVESVEKSRWEISPKPLETLQKAVRLFSLTR